MSLRIWWQISYTVCQKNAQPMVYDDLYHLSKIIYIMAQRILPRTRAWNLQQTQKVCKSKGEDPQEKAAQIVQIIFDKWY